MIQPHIKLRICQYLAGAKLFEELEELKRASKEWCYTVLSFQWKEYIDKRGPRWYLPEDRAVTPFSVESRLKQARPDFSADFYEYGHNFVKTLTIKNDQ